MDDFIKEQLAKIIYECWRNEKYAQGYHLPALCPDYEKEVDRDEVNFNDDIVHCNKCLTTLVDFHELSKYRLNEYMHKAVDFIKKLDEYGIELKKK